MFFLIFKGSLNTKSYVQSMLNMYWPHIIWDHPPLVIDDVDLV